MPSAWRCSIACAAAGRTVSANCTQPQNFFLHRYQKQATNTWCSLLRRYTGHVVRVEQFVGTHKDMLSCDARAHAPARIRAKVCRGRQGERFFSRIAHQRHAEWVFGETFHSRRDR